MTISSFKHGGKVTDLLNRIPGWIRWILYIFVPYLIGRLCVSLIALPLGYILNPGFEPNLMSTTAIAMFSIIFAVIPTICIGYFAYIFAPRIKFMATLLQLIVWGLWKTKIFVEYISYLHSTGNSNLLYSWMSILTYASYSVIVISSILIILYIYRYEKNKH